MGAAKPGPAAAQPYFVARLPNAASGFVAALVVAVEVLVPVFNANALRETVEASQECRQTHMC